MSAPTDEYLPVQPDDPPCECGNGVMTYPTAHWRDVLCERRCSWCGQTRTTTGMNGTPPAGVDKVWLFRAVVEGVDGDHWGTCSAPSKLDALSRIGRRMRQRIKSDSDEIDVSVWEHDFFTLAGGYL